MKMKRLLGILTLTLVSGYSTTTNSTPLLEKKYPAKPENCAIKVYSIGSGFGDGD